MDLEVAKLVFENTDDQRNKFAKRYKESVRYYNNENDITKKNGGKDKLDDNGKENSDGIRKADNRIGNGYHRILVDQKSQYVGGIVPTFDVEDDALNKGVLDALGDNYDRTFNRLVVDASNAGTGWIHYWVDDETNEFRYATIDPSQITPIYDESLVEKLLAVRRTYEALDTETGEVYIYDEYWTDTTAQFFKREKGKDYDSLMSDERVPVIDVNIGETVEAASELQHDFGRVPFIPFMNNQDGTPDLQRYKGLIDVYDRVYSGFVNDVDDVQQVILVLTNYGEAGSADEFKAKLKRDQVINIEKYGDGDKSGLDTLTIDIPIEARNNLLDRTREAIFLHGQGVDPLRVELGTNSSGVALKMIYTLLELKSSAVESEFRPALSELIRAVLRYLGDAKVDKRRISQVWTRAAVKDETEQADIISKLADVTSAEAIAKANPLVTDWQNELLLREEETGNDYYKLDNDPEELKDDDDKEKAVEDDDSE
ncbi:phage portal protein [Weissella ceti]|uniref:Phage portal protein n=1 Tax=Weissella ceti TaxID=759620 RepID=A0ABT3E4B3_9LACO|nr:phage portal protein [Weissella ceti]MCW0953200.1 phage portal protein [Weissella ceti]QVK12717.1 phage portal protein [Weissella ceti]